MLHTYYIYKQNNPNRFSHSWSIIMPGMLYQVAIFCLKFPFYLMHSYYYANHLLITVLFKQFSVDLQQFQLMPTISNQSASVYVYLEGTKVIFQCNNVSHTELTTTCHADGSWRPPPSELDCTTSGIYST